MVAMRGGSAMEVPAGLVAPVSPVVMVVWVARSWAWAVLVVPGVLVMSIRPAAPVVMVVPGWGGCSVVAATAAWGLPAVLGRWVPLG
jgi:hypothetical protein